MNTEQAKQLSETTLTRLMAALEAGQSEALKQYLVLAPDGAHANDVKQMLDFLK